jgi:hypothetical protein
MLDGLLPCQVSWIQKGVSEHGQTAAAPSSEAEMDLRMAVEAGDINLYDSYLGTVGA